MNKYLVFRTGFDTQGFEIECNNKTAFDLVSFLFCDFPQAYPNINTQRFGVVSAGKPAQLSLWKGDKKLYFGPSPYQLAYILMNEVIYYCIKDHNQKNAIHAGAVYNENRCIILPGSSGKGKSTLTAWLVANGYQYLTDELIFIADDGKITPLTRPINLKVSDAKATWLFKRTISGNLISDENGVMIPHRQINPQFSAIEPYVTDIFFPHYQKGSKLMIQELSPAKSCLYLIQSHVNARNLKGHGLSSLSSIVKRCKSYHLTYASFDDLPDLFNIRTSQMV